MGTPTQKRSKGSKKRRAAHFAIKKQSLVQCSNCGCSLLPHRACPACGYFRGKKVIK